MTRFIQAIVSDEVHRLFENHPRRRKTNQRPFAGEILQKYVESPEGQIPILKEQINNLVSRVDWMSRQLERMASLESRVQELEKLVPRATVPAAS